MEMASLGSDVVCRLIEISHKVKSKSYSPYSNFRVGAAILTTDGTIFTGCNVENVSYGLAICAERTAIVKAVSEGYREFSAISIASDLKSTFIVPCGACRQFLAEFGLDWDVYLTKVDQTYKVMKVKELLPFTFSPDDLKRERIGDGDKKVKQ